MKSSNKSTIKDVAEIASTSIATVSRVLSKSDYPISDELRDRVEKAAAKLGFSKTVAAKSRKKGDQQNIGLIVPTLTNPFYIQTIQGISSVCDEKGYNLILCNSQRKLEKEQSFLQEFYENKILKVIISSVSENSSLLNAYIEKGMRFIQLDQQFEESESHHINYDSKQGANLAVKHLVDNGHRQIAFVSTPLTRWTREKIYEGYKNQLKLSDINFDINLSFIINIENLLEKDNYEVLAGQQAADEFAISKCKATAIFCVNDMVAFGVINGLKKNGIEVPADISVVGFDDIAFSEIFIPALTTVHCASYEAGRLAAVMLIEELQENRTNNGLNMQLQPCLIIRDTVRDIRHN